MICLNCNHFDFNDCVHGFGTCESLDADFKAYHECTCPKSELLLIEKLDIYFEEAYYCPDCYGNNKAFNQISLARRNIKRPNNTITYGE